MTTRRIELEATADRQPGSEPPELPFDRPPSLAGGAERARVTRAVPCGPSAIARLGAELGVPAEHVVLAAWTVVLATYSRRPGLLVGVAIDGTTVGVDVDVHPGSSFGALVSQVADGLASSDPASSSSHPAVFVLGPAGRVDAVPTTPYEASLESTGAAARLVAGYDAARFEQATAARMLDHLATVLSDVVESGAARLVDDLRVVPLAELSLLAVWNDTARDLGSETLASLFGHAAGRSGSSVALQLSGRRDVTYAELARSADQVARRLLELGVGRGAMVGVLAERSVELLAAVHGVVLAGAAYVPLDPEHPIERISHMIGETGMKVVLCQGRFEGLVADPEVVVVDVEALPAVGDDDAGGDLALPRVEPDDVAYVIYTSGSTGRPKGAAITHRAIANRLQWMQERFGLSPGDVVLHKTPFGFDVSVWELFWPLQVGARLVIADPGGHRDPAYLVQTITGHAVDTIHFVPSMLRLFLDHPAAGSCTSLRRVVCSGEALTRDLQDRFFAVLPGAELHNLYGPTEAAVDVTAWECRPDDELPIVPIGAPIANTTIHILDGQMRRLPIGVPGELHIGGVQVAAGYVGREELTAERFVADPFDPSGRLYKTGDLARWVPDGQIDFLGRLDQQVKLRGQRIELGEIESVLGEHPAILEAAVELRGEGGDARLVAHVMSRGHAAAEGELRAFLERRLPAAMVPARYVSHDALPLTPSGKVDRKALAAHLLPARELRRTTAGANELETFLLDLWCSLLDRSDVGREDRVFDLGASSLQAAAFVNALQRELDEFIYVVTVFSAPTVADYAALLAREYPEAVARRFGGAAPSARAPRDRRVDEAALERMSGIVPSFEPFPAWRTGEPNPAAAFILSPPRSGTTLLRVMLAGHPGLFAAPELQLLGFDTLPQRRSALDGRFSPWREGTIRAVMELERCDAATATELMESCEREGLTAKAFYRRLQDRAHGRMLVDKSPTYALDLETLRNAEHGFDAPRYIHLIREPLAMSRSFESYHMDQILFLHDHSWSGRVLGELVWTLSHRNILAFAEEVPEERMLRLRFEDLVADPRSTMTEVAAFLGLGFDESLIRPYEQLETKMVDGLHPESTPMGDTRLLERDRIDPDVVGKWEGVDGRSTLGEPTVRLAARLGYGTPAHSAEAARRRRFADTARRRRAARRAGD